MHRVASAGTGHPTAPSLPAARAAAVAALVLLESAIGGCDLVRDPQRPAFDFAFRPPLVDTVVNLGDTTAALACDLVVDGRPVPCRLGLTVVDGDVVSVVGDRVAAERGRYDRPNALQALALGTVRVAMRPLHIQLPTDTVVRFARLRTVVPRLDISNCRTGVDTLRGVAQERLYQPLPHTRDGRAVPFVDVTWRQESGAGVALLIPGEQGTVHTLANGEAVFRASVDSASARCRVVVTGAP